MTENPFNPPSSPPSNVQEARHPGWNSNPLTQLFHGRHIGLRILRICVYAAFPLPIMLATSLVIVDLYHFNHQDSEFLRLSESYEAGYLLFDFLLYLAIGVFYLALPLLAFSSVLELFCKKVATRILTGIGFGILLSSIFMLTLNLIGSFTFNFASHWELAEACAEFLNPIVVLVGVSLFASLFPGNTNQPPNEAA